MAQDLMNVNAAVFAATKLLFSITKSVNFMIIVIANLIADEWAFIITFLI